jgi:cyclopropane fatty-acyl-phospholipid synthase-like methyltransferase
MTASLSLTLGIIIVGSVIGLIWRISSNRLALPCPSWLGWMVELDNPFTKVNRAQFIVDNLQLSPGMRVLDAGCGPGRVTLPLADAVAPRGEVWAMDIQEGMLARVQDKVQAAGIQNVEYLQAGLGKGLLPKAYFDRAVLVTVLDEIPDWNSALQEIYDALKPTGILSVTEVIFDPHFQSYENVLKDAEAHGFVGTSFFGRKLAYSLHLQKPHIIN